MMLPRWNFQKLLPGPPRFYKKIIWPDFVIIYNYFIFPELFCFCYNDSTVTFVEGGLLIDAMSNTQDNPTEKLSSTPLKVVENGCGSPCIDLRKVSSELAAVAKDADLVILEGMGCALHTNYNARFKCDALKVNTCSCHHWF
ncbi:putative pantothenate kinase [Helianthus debilis subsp. tardiflorus]